MFSAYLETLKKVSLFKNIRDDELLKVLSCIRARVKHFEKGNILAEIGAPIADFGIILNGQITISKEGVDGSRVIMAILEQCDIYGEIAAFSNNPVMPATVIANESCDILCIPRDTLISGCESVCSFHNTLTSNLLKIIASKAFILNKKVEYLSIKSMRGKIAAYLLDLNRAQGTKTLQLPLNRNELADFLNVSRPSMSRELARLKEEGILDFYLSTIKILKLEELMNISL
jgi:CRP-like cAMP-binding protein